MANHSVCKNMMKYVNKLCHFTISVYNRKFYLGTKKVKTNKSV